jgi:hypothetical protein
MCGPETWVFVSNIHHACVAWYSWEIVNGGECTTASHKFEETGYIIKLHTSGFIRQRQKLFFVLQCLGACKDCLWRYKCCTKCTSTSSGNTWKYTPITCSMFKPYALWSVFHVWMHPVQGNEVGQEFFEQMTNYNMTFHVSGRVNSHNVIVWGHWKPPCHLKLEKLTPKVNVWCSVTHYIMHRPLFCQGDSVFETIPQHSWTVPHVTTST